MTKNELIEVRGGGGISASMLNAVARVASVLYELGRSLGSAIRRTSSGNICK